MARWGPCILMAVHLKLNGKRFRAQGSGVRATSNTRSVVMLHPLKFWRLENPMPVVHVQRSLEKLTCPIDGFSLSFNFSMIHCSFFVVVVFAKLSFDKAE
ncbi:predicted protein [Coccidioides posadasii str. Silveira]|uniref:Predicted protein n=1 Tax=Coccidioides posadasii (strain RMSCC 757 / Silveira) TaxID=443226 RepID=E9DAP6_COCPS|nr:predicted protein [Coccidioides posadasii str. Silveira]